MSRAGLRVDPRWPRRRVRSARPLDAVIEVESSVNVAHWESLASDWSRSNPQQLWRLHSDAINRALLERWLPASGLRALLKTDLFDEAFGDGLLPPLVARARDVVGIDVATGVIEAARSRAPRLVGVRSDVRHLPFADNAFDAVVSISTLDHFETRAEIDASLAEIFRVLAPGGRFVLTLDNAVNPVVALRNALPFRALRAVGLVPYFVGATYGPQGVRRALLSTGFRILDSAATFHCPRVLAVPLAASVQRRGGERARRVLARSLYGFEKLARLPTRYLTGHFVAVLAEKA